MDDAEWGGLFLFDRRVLKAVCFKLPGEASVQSDVGLDIMGGSWVGKAIQKVGRRNCPPCLRNQYFPKSVRASLGVVGMSDPVSIYLQGFKPMEG